MIKKTGTSLAILVSVLSIGIGSAWGLSAIESLGQKIFMDEDLSINRNQSCMTCHHPAVAFVDPVNTRNPYCSVVSEGSIAGLFGGRNAPTATYAGFSPVFGWDKNIGGYVGGLFWDGRATGESLKDPLAEQAQGPFLNPVEMALGIPDPDNPDKMVPDLVIERISESTYACQFEKVFPGTNFEKALEKAEDGNRKLLYKIYDNVARAIAAFEKSEKLNRFCSVFDEFWEECKNSNIDISLIGIATDLQDVPRGILSQEQLEGLALFNGKGQCALCHVLTDYEEGVIPPLFTDFTYDNLGIPANPLLEGNPTDYGLGGILGETDQNGKFKVSTLRNIARTPPYGHNGFFATLEEIVHFYNTRDVPDEGWPPPEVPENVNTTELGNLGLTLDEEAAIVAFMKCLSD
ncbi:cytochrome C [Desulfonema ishimotonii]|uniref:Cytochrome C n=1 Tax=Desulfonema ishimotonii TaxID=45657 RepID=A0A401FW41_9BACT|nr:cytochrome c peroxidase [Desulfonema ishimotonii]GBC61169.1 cytochrome C [Desulfonema ishimotonii]